MVVWLDMVVWQMIFHYLILIYLGLFVEGLYWTMVFNV